MCENELPIRQGFQKLSDRQTDRQIQAYRHTRPKLYTTPLRGRSNRHWNMLLIIIRRPCTTSSNNRLSGFSCQTILSSLYRKRRKDTPKAPMTDTICVSPNNLSVSSASAPCEASRFSYLINAYSAIIITLGTLTDIVA